LRLLNILARVVGIVFILTGIGLLLGAVVMAELHIVELIGGIFSLVAGVLFVRVRKATIADIEKYFGRRK
jgi:hypothetical protein